MKTLNYVKILLLCVFTIGLASCGDDVYYTMQNSDDKYLVILSIVLNLVHIIDPKGKLIPEKETASSQFYGYTLRVAPLLFSMAQEQFVSETKPTRGLFIPYSICNEPYLCCENCKAD